MNKKIGILTSGGDAPGMNTCVAAAIKAGINSGNEMYVFWGGYKGLVEGKYTKVDKDFMENHANLGGTYIGTARCLEFKQPEVREKAVKDLKKVGLDALIVIGGDGSFMGAEKLTELGINCVGIPATIDGDIASTKYTIGFDTAINTIVNSIDNIRETTASHDRCHVIEIMGNQNSSLTIYAGMATFADFIVTRENFVSYDNLIEQVKAYKAAGHKYCLVLVSEKFLDTDLITKRINDEVGYETRSTVLGHIQRGGRPTAKERVMAVRYAVEAIRLINEGKGGICLCLDGDNIIYRDILKAVDMPKHEYSACFKYFEEIK